MSAVDRAPDAAPGAAVRAAAVGESRAGAHGVVFDIDGTLLDTMTTIPQVYADTVRSLGGPTLPLDEIVAAWHIGPTPAVLAHFLGRRLRPDEVERYYAHLEAAVDAVRPFPGVAEMLDTLRGEGYRLGVYTAATRRAVTLMLAATGLDGYLPGVVGGDEVSRPKPAPSGLRLACRRIGVVPGRAAYIGDAEVDLECARAAGVLGIQACWGGGTARATARLVARRPADVVELLRRAGTGAPEQRQRSG